MDRESTENQLKEVRALLKDDPGNSGYIQLEKTLVEALELLDDQSGDSEESLSEVEEEEDYGTTEETAVRESRENSAACDSENSAGLTGKRSRDSANVGTLGLSADGSSAAKHDLKTKDAEYESGRNEAKLSVDIENIILGNRCEAFNDVKSVWQGALLDSYENEDGEVSVTLLHDRSKKRISSANVRPMKRKRLTYDVTALQIGQKCSSRYSGDEKWYPAEIMQLTRNGCVVQYKKYRNQEEVAFEHLQVDTKQKVHAEESGYSKSAVVAEIPKHLQKLETDTEKVKARKQSTMNLLRRESNKAQKDLILTRKQQGWQAFQAKGKHKKRKLSSKKI